MRYFHKTNNQFHCPTINVDKLWSLVEEPVCGLREPAVVGFFRKVALTLLRLVLSCRMKAREKLFKEATEAKAPVIDCVAQGYYKVLGNGRLPAKPVIVKAKFFSHLAEKKIKEAGGVCVTVA